MFLIFKSLFYRKLVISSVFVRFIKPRGTDFIGDSYHRASTVVKNHSKEQKTFFPPRASKEKFFMWDKNLITMAPKGKSIS